MDEEIVVDFIAKKFKSDSLAPADTGAANEVRRRSRQYLEKLCQGVYHLPYARHPAALFLRYLETAIRGRNPVEGEQELAATSAMREVFGRLPEAAHPVPPNPRKIKLLAAVTARFCESIRGREFRARQRRSGLARVYAGVLLSVRTSSV